MLKSTYKTKDARTVKFDSQSAIRLRSLTYPLASVPEQFLLNEVDQIFQGVICAPNAKHSKSDYLESIREALATGDDLGEVVGLGHGDAALRSLFKALEERIVRN